MSKAQEKEIRKLMKSYHQTGRVGFLLKASQTIRKIKYTIQRGA